MPRGMGECGVRCGRLGSRALGALEAYQAAPFVTHGPIPGRDHVPGMPEPRVLGVP
jgi:hypothetical protein